MKKLLIISAMFVGLMSLQACDKKEQPKVEEEKAATLGLFDNIVPTYRTAPDPAGDALRQMNRK